MIFKTIDDNDSLSGQRIVSTFTARKIAQEEAAKQLEIDIQCLRNYETECQKGSVSTETFSNTMKGASIEAQKYATNIKNGTGSSQTFATNQRTIQASMSETSIVSKVAATGLSIFKAALNSLIFFAVVEGIQLLIKGIDNLILTADEAEEKAEALRGNMQSFFDEVQSGQQTISSVSDRFSELSEHVTKTGENIDLTKDEYSEYLDICNQVKTIMPELVTGYTNEGNAIITLKDNVDSLTESYKENIRAKASAFITNGDDDGNTIQSFFDDYKIFTKGENGLFAPSASGLWNNKSTDYEDYYGYDKVHEWLEDVADLSLKDLQNLQKGTTQATYLYALLKENGYELANITEDNYEAVHDVLDTRLTSLEGEMATRVSNVKMSLQQMLYADRDYWDIDDKEALSAIDSMFSSIDSEFIKQNNLLGQDALQSFESNVIKLFENKDTQKAMIDIYTPQGDDESIEDYSKRVNDAIEKVQNYVKDKKIDVPIDFTDATGSVEDLQKSYEDTINRFKSDTSDSSSKELDSLNKQLDEQTQSLTDAKENLQNEYNKISDWELDDYADQIKNGTLPSQFGNVDMDNRQIIDWNIDNIEKWKDALSDIKYYDKDGNFIESYYDQLKESAENGESCIDSVFGDMMDHIEGYGDITALAFSHVVNNDDGTFEFLGQKTAEEYLYGILDVAKQDGDMSIDHILELDKKGFENAEVYDAQGKVIGETYIHGIISGFNENAADISSLTHFAGKDGAIQIAQSDIDIYNKQIEETKKKIKEVSKGFDDSKKIKDFFDTKGINTDEEINEFNEITKGITDADLAIQTWNEHVSETATQSKTFESVWTSTSEEVKKKLLELAKSGEITPETISSTEEYKTLIDGTGESAESAKNKILNMLSATEKLSGASKGLSSLKTAYQEFADENNGKGFVTASTLESLPDVFKNLPHYDLFEQIVGDPNSGKEKIQSAFNDIAKDYLINQQTLMGVTQENMATYVANLKEMGIQNADEIVQNFVQAQNQQSQLLSEAESEYNNYLQTKDQADLEYLKSSSSKNGQLVSALGSAYQGDYANWCNLLTTKAQAYNKFINAIKGSQASLINNTPFQSGTKQAQAIINDVKNHNGRTGGGTSLSLSNTNGLKGLGGTLMSSSAASPSRYTKEQYDAAKSYMDQVNQYNQLKSQLKLDLTNITTNFGGGYSFKPSSSGKSGGGSKSPSGGGSGSEKEPTKKDYDWIETLISRINRQVSNLGKTVSATYKTWSTRNNALAQELGSVNQQISAEQQAYNKYMQLANSVGLPEGYASLVRNGTIDVSTIADDDLNDKISKYQEYYNAALSAADTVQDLQDKLAELAKTKFDNISSDFEAQIDQIKHSTTMYQSYIDQVEAEDAIPVRSYYENMIANEQQTISRLKDEYSQLTNAMNEALNTGRIQAYSEEWYNMRASINSVDEAIQDANKSIIEYTKSMKELSKTKFNKISTAYENASGFNDHAKNMYNGLIDQADAEGRFASKDYYSALMDMEKLNIKTLTQESNDLHKSLQEAMNKGDIEEYSDDWYEMMGKINDVDEAIMDANKSLTEYGNSMRQLDWDLFDKQEEYISKIQEESDFLVDLMSNQKLYDDDTGKDTKYATAIKGLHVVNYDVYKAQAQDYAKEIEKINKDLADDPNNMKLIERKQELIKAQQDAIANAEQEKQAIKSLVKDGIDAQLDALQKLIDKYKNSLQATKDLYDYEKNVKEQTDSLAALQKQRQALGGDNSEETQSKIQQLDQQIKDAKSNLEDTEYQQYLSDQEQLLSTFYDETEEWLNARLDDLDGLIQQVIDDTNTNSGNIAQTITDTTNGVGYTITNAMATIWSTADGNIAGYMNTISGNITGTTATVGDNISKVISAYGDNLNGIAGTTGTAVNNIKELVQYLVDDAKRKKEAEEAAKRAAEAAKRAAEEAQRKAQEAAAQKAAQQQAQAAAQQQSRPSSSGGGGGSSSGGSSGGGNGAWGSWFIHQADSYPKNRLDINNSIVDKIFSPR